MQFDIFEVRYSLCKQIKANSLIYKHLSYGLQFETYLNDQDQRMV